MRVWFCACHGLGDDKRSIAGTRLTGSLPDEALLRTRVMLKLVDKLLLLMNLFEEGCVLLLQLAHYLAFFVKCAEPLRPAQHDGGVGSQSNEA